MRAYCRRCGEYSQTTTRNGNECCGECGSRRLDHDCPSAEEVRRRAAQVRSDRGVKPHGQPMERTFGVRAEYARRVANEGDPQEE